MHYFRLCLLCLPLLLLSALANGHEHHARKAAEFVGTVEQGNNRGQIVDVWNAAAGVPVGSPYCASFVSWCLSQVRCTAIATRSARAKAFASERRGKVLDITARTEARAGDIIVWHRAGGGHIGIVIANMGNGYVRTIEANTSSGSSGSQWNGSGVWIRTRKLYMPGSKFRPVCLVRARQ